METIGVLQGSRIFLNSYALTLWHSERPKLHRVLAILDAIGLKQSYFRGALAVALIKVIKIQSQKSFLECFIPFVTFEYCIYWYYVVDTLKCLHKVHWYVSVRDTSSNDTSSKFFVELPVRRKVTSSNAFSSNTTLSRNFCRARRPKISRRRHAVLGILIMCLSREIGNFSFKSRKETPQKLTQLSSRSHPRHLVGKRTAQKDITIDTTSDSQVNSSFPNRWSPASLTFNNYFYLFLYLYIT